MLAVTKVAVVRFFRRRFPAAFGMTRIPPSFRVAWILAFASGAGVGPAAGQVDGRVVPDVDGAGRNRALADPELDLVWISPGRFLMLVSSSGMEDDRPPMQVVITRGFWMGKTEVTQAQWRMVMGTDPSEFEGANRPVERVSWEDAMEFGRKLTERERRAGRLPSGYVYTLPTEAQWEFACRAGTTGDHAGDLDAMAWYLANARDATHPVARKQANKWGLHDMHGNVWEWCLDSDLRRLPGQSVSDPRGVSSGVVRAVRGGSWSLSADSCRSGNRSAQGRKERSGEIGFRLALAPLAQKP